MSSSGVSGSNAPTPNGPVPAAPSRVRIGLHRALAPWAPEVRYTLNTILDAAGLARSWTWAEPGAEFDLYYGPDAAAHGARARIVLPWSGEGFDRAAEREPTAFGEPEGWAQVAFGDGIVLPPTPENGSLRFATDPVFGAFWFLSGAREPAYERDRFDNLSIAGFLRTGGLRGRPWISLLAARLRAAFVAAGFEAAAPEPCGSALAISHDVDYPEIRRVVELLRRPAQASAILTERDPFWCFDAWADFSEGLGTRSTFYFMARQGSLLRYAAGDPDGFYDVGSPRYRELLRALVERGCEIGLHASFRSSERPERYAAEKARIEDAAGTGITGNRQHYWRLDPTAPHRSLAQLAEAGFRYDSSLAFERMPGFRRGTCHPFRPWHAERREALDLIEVSPAWMDDHYDSRFAETGIPDPAEHARSLLSDVAASGGAAVLDYHVRGMNRRFFPKWGAWLEQLLAQALPDGMKGRTVNQIAEAWRAHEAALAAASRDELAGVE